MQVSAPNENRLFMAAGHRSGANEPGAAFSRYSDGLATWRRILSARLHGRRRDMSHPLR